MIFSGKKFCQFKKSLYLCTAILESTPAKGSELTAKVAQLVEHDLAKVGVAGPSPVFRSIFVQVAELVDALL